LRLQLRDRAIFISHDCETELPFAMNTFDIIFARGVFVFNQHDMMRPGCLDLLQHWHYLLNKKGRFVAMYGSKPERFGTYTPATETKGLPTNLFARETAAVNFRAGKFNHSPSSFISPFLELESVMLDAYHFSHGRHTLITKHNHSESPQV
jgi:SAM-dependent methyltransferase